MKTCTIVSLAARLAFFILLASLVACRAADSYNGIHLDRVRLPPGFKIDLYADNVAGARSMVMSPAGSLFVGSREAGNVYAVVDRDGDFRADEIITLLQG